MSVAYQAVGWNRQKKIYDAVLLAGVLLYLGLFVTAGLVLRPEITAETLLIRAFGTAALLLLHVVLSIGPLCRLDRRFLPLLYNRRHLGVTMFVLALAHGVFSIFQFHALGDTNPLLSVLVANTRFESLAQFPFQPLGLAALLILFLMAATSHDFWLANLTAPVWKALHMLVYLAYALIVAHVALGVLQDERHPLLTILLGLGMAWILGLHLIAGWRERRGDRPAAMVAAERAGMAGFVDVGAVDDIPEDRARIVPLAGERVAVFRYDGKVSAISNVCKHQNGPLGEGKIVDGCVVCPWHGYQYRPADGASPPPFTEKVPTFRVRVRDGRVLVDPRPLPPGTPVEPALVTAKGHDDADDLYVGYLPQAPPAIAAHMRRAIAVLLAAAAALALATVWAQAPFARASFEFGVDRDFAGIVRLDPHPALEVARPGRGETGVSRYHLVAPGKHGADSLAAPFADRAVTLRGSLIYRASETMIEVEPGSIAAGDAAGDAAAASSAPAPRLGEQTLVGEIVDAKCHLGVMKPGEGKPHRSCAVRCISGGVQPIFVLRDARGPARWLLLVGADGRPVRGAGLRVLLDHVAEPLEITGEVVRHGDGLRLEADPGRYRRLR